MHSHEEHYLEENDYHNGAINYTCLYNSLTPCASILRNAYNVVWVRCEQADRSRKKWHFCSAHKNAHTLPHTRPPQNEPNRRTFFSPLVFPRVGKISVETGGGAHPRIFQIEVVSQPCSPTADAGRGTPILVCFLFEVSTNLHGMLYFVYYFQVIPPKKEKSEPVSCCVIVHNVERNVYFLPRQKRMRSTCIWCADTVVTIISRVASFY